MQFIAQKNVCSIKNEMNLNLECTLNNRIKTLSGKNRQIGHNDNPALLLKNSKIPKFI